MPCTRSSLSSASTSGLFPSASAGQITTSPSNPSSPSCGNDSTSVGPSSPVYRRCKSAISSTVTKETESSPEVTPSRARTSRPSWIRPFSLTGASCRSEIRISGWWGSPSFIAGGAAPFAEHAVRLHDVLHDLVANHVTRAHVDELEPVDPLQDLLHDDQSAALAGREVGLGGIAVDDGLRPE